jgi:hypothetical protein
LAQKYFYEVIVRFVDGKVNVYYPEVEDAVVNYSSFRQEDGSWVFPRTMDGIEYPDWFAADVVFGVTVAPFKGYRVQLKCGAAIFVKPPVTRERILDAMRQEITKRQETVDKLKEELDGHNNPVPVPSASADQGQPDAD